MNLSGPGGALPLRGVGRRPLWPYSINKLSLQFEGLVAWFPLAYGISDERLRGAHGTADAAIVWTSDITVGPIGNFDGVDTTIISYAVNTDFQLAGDATFAFWLQPKSGVTYASAGSAADVVFGHLGVGEGQPENALYYIYLTDQDASNARLNIGWETGSGTNTDIAFTTNITKGVTSHIALVRDTTAKTVALYLNGILVETSSAYTNNPDGGTTGTLGIGGLPTGGTGCSMFITDLRLYNKKVADATIRQMYEASTRWQLLTPRRGKVFIAKTGPVTQPISPTATLTLSGGLTKKFTPGTNYAGTLTTAATLSNNAARTRLYFSSVSGASAAPAFDAGWNYTTEASRWRLKHVKGSSAMADGTQIGAWSNTAGQRALDRQYVSNPLDGAQNVGGTIKGQLLVQEFANTDNVDQIICVIKVVSIDGGTLRGTILAIGSRGPTGEFRFSGYRNKFIADGDGSSIVAAQNGDRIVIEIGYSNSTAATTPEARARWGENAADLPEDESQTADGAGWIEFGTTNTFQNDAAGGLDAGGTVTPTGNLIKQVGKLFN